MKICPKCGFLENEYWRQNRWRPNVEWTKPEEFAYNHPELYKQFNSEAVVMDKFYAYKKGGRSLPVIQRVLLTEYQNFGEVVWSMPAEHTEHGMPRRTDYHPKVRDKVLKKQTKLEVVTSSK